MKRADKKQIQLLVHTRDKENCAKLLEAKNRVADQYLLTGHEVPDAVTGKDHPLVCRGVDVQHLDVAV